jgi:DME family drug/metabolite transporter
MEEREGVLSIASSGILYGLVTVGGSLLSRIGFSVLDVSFFFIFFSILALAPFALKKNPNLLSVMRSNWKFFILYAVVNLIILVSQFGSLALGLEPPIVALLLYTQPIWTMIFGRFAFSEKITVGRITIIILALIGVFLVTNPISFFSQQVGLSTTNQTDKLYSELLALLGGLFLSLWLILGKKGRMSRIEEPVSLTFAVRSFSLIPIGIVSLLAFGLGTRLFLSSPVDFNASLGYLVLFAIFAGAIPDYLFYRGVRKVAAVQAGVILLLEPVSAAVISIVIHIATLNLIQIAGGVLILLSNYFVVIERRQNTGQNEKGLPN